MSPNPELVRSLYAARERGDYGSVSWADPEIESAVVEGPSPGTSMGVAGRRCPRTRRVFSRGRPSARDSWIDRRALRNYGGHWSVDWFNTAPDSRDVLAAGIPTSPPHDLLPPASDADGSEEDWSDVMPMESTAPRGPEQSPRRPEGLGRCRLNPPRTSAVRPLIAQYRRAIPSAIPALHLPLNGGKRRTRDRGADAEL
jgi:hypothetical protein